MGVGKSSGPVIAVLVKSKEPKVLRKAAPYLRWVRRGGGTPVSVFPGGRIPKEAAGVLFLGGEDVDPSRYGEENHHCERINEPRDRFEFGLLPGLLKGRLPMLAVCRGMQVLAVALGGRLHQDVEAERARRGVRSRVLHRGRDHTDSTHRVTIPAGTLLARLIGRRTLLVNSHHHQAVRSVPRGTRVSARALDGTVEAIEHVGPRFILGLQWHPERWPRASSDAIIRGFLAACGRK